jgi:hypothetical protein
VRARAPSIRKQFFFEKKNQKTFAIFIPPIATPTDKSLLLLFFRKEDLPSFFFH